MSEEFLRFKTRTSFRRKVQSVNKLITRTPGEAERCITVLNGVVLLDYFPVIDPNGQARSLMGGVGWRRGRSPLQNIFLFFIRFTLRLRKK